MSAFTSIAVRGVFVELDGKPVIAAHGETVETRVVPAHLAMPACVACSRPSGLLDENSECPGCARDVLASDDRRSE